MPRPYKYGIIFGWGVSASMLFILASESSTFTEENNITSIKWTYCTECSEFLNFASFISQRNCSVKIFFYNLPVTVWSKRKTTTTGLQYCSPTPHYRTQWTVEGSVFGTVSLWFLSVDEISLQPLNGFAPNSHGRRFWFLARASLKVKVKGQGHQGQKRHFSALSAACVRFVWWNIVSL